jgi:3-deoxy-D-manno-octulosonic-acid transferase
MIDLGFFALYRFLLAPLAISILHLSRFLWPEKIRTMISERRQKNFQHLPSRPFWIHASSGEIEYAKSVIRALKETFPQVPVLVTYFSPSAKKLIREFAGVDLVLPLPWDTRSDVSRFLRFYRPRALLVARTDVWPELVYQARQQKIPSLLFAATLAEKSSRRSGVSAPLSRFAFHCLDEIFCVSESDADNFIHMGVKTPVRVTGDTRFDQVLYRLRHSRSLPTSLQPPKQVPIWVIGSSWSEDEEVLLPAVKAWCESGRKVILAPHETQPARIENLHRKISALSLTVTTSSATSSWEEDVLLVDQVGFLQELYALAAQTPGSFAFVGGSFKGKVHSVMEPLACGLPVAVGPYHLNNREALQFQHVTLAPGFFAVNVVTSTAELLEVQNHVQQQPETAPLLRQKVERFAGATSTVTEWVSAAVRPLTNL